MMTETNRVPLFQVQLFLCCENATQTNYKKIPENMHTHRVRKISGAKLAFSKLFTYTKIFVRYTGTEMLYKYIGN